jgi:S1-C subfamily serine protease
MAERMDEQKSDPPKPREYHVLVEGQMHGPFTSESLKAALETGDVTPEDLVQVGGLPIWRPLRQVLDSPQPRTPGSVWMESSPPPLSVAAAEQKNTGAMAGVNVRDTQGSETTEEPEDSESDEFEESVLPDEMERSTALPDWKELGQLSWNRLRNDFEERSVGTGLICLGIGVVACLAAFWPFLFWLPWFGLAFFAGFDALKRGKTMQGVGLLVAACGLPIVLSTLVSSVRQRAVGTADVQFNGSSGRVLGTNTTPARSAAPAPQTDTPVRSFQPAVPLTIESVRPESPKQEEMPSQPPTEPLPAGANPAANKTVAAPSTPAPVARPISPPSEAILPVAALPPTLEPSAIQEGGTKGSTPPSLGKSAPAPLKPIVSGEFVQMYRNAFVVVKDGSASGSGFICRDGQKTYLYTNAHVVGGMRNPQFSSLDGSQIRVASAEAGGPRDVVRFAVAEPALSLEILPNLDASVRIGDQVVVLGNSGGGGVVTTLEGKLAGIGPDRIEVTAEFIPGNSGSPIVHVPTGKVIGIATYLMRRHEEFGGGETVRRFGYRLDQIERWEPVNWTVFQGDAEQIRQISSLTADIFNFIEALEKRREPQFETATLRRPATEWLAGIRKTSVSDVDRSRATQAFLSSLRFMVRADVATAENRIRYSYFREQLRKEREVRDRLYKSFDDEVKKLVSPSMR